MMIRFDTHSDDELKLHEASYSMFEDANYPIAFFNTDGSVLNLNGSLLRLLDSLMIDTVPDQINDLLLIIGDTRGIPAEIFQNNHTERPLFVNINDVRISTIEKFGPLIHNEVVLGGYVMIIDISEAAASFDERDRRLRELINNVGIGIVILNQEHKVIDTNARFAEMLGYSIDEMYNLHIWDWDANMSEAEIRETFSDISGAEGTMETRHRRKDGTIYDVHISVYGAKLKDEGGSYSASICVCQDVTERTEMQRRLQLSEFKYRNLVENSSELVLSMNEDSTLEYVSSNCETLTGYLPNEIQGRSIADFISVEVLDQIQKKLQELHDSSSPVTHDLALTHKDGSEHWYNIRIAPAFDIDGIRIFIIHALNIDERKEYEGKLEYLSTHDQLTGTYNRRFFDTYFDKQFEIKKYPLSILLCDIDNLKAINDTRGHAEGDEIIKSCAQAIQSTLRRGDFLARMGGDEFVAALPQTDEAETLKIIERIKQSITNVNQELSDSWAKLSVSIGHATTYDGSSSIEDLLSKADTRMYAQKRM
ncbi:MAG: diguanylate cyclase [Coriobacteriaceae bacterium]|nr:diguanylate cyclase [Coriobacteriaceae bacterium]